ncbi:MAG: cyclic pyranopterin monophosphate synthase MoaC [Pseudomonadota bacterium]
MSNDTNTSLTHFDAEGRARMVDVTDKGVTERTATARGRVNMAPETLNIVRSGTAKKGDVLTVAELAGVMGAKRTSDLIPLCHPLPISGAKVEIETSKDAPALIVTARVKTTGRTGVEMEALTAVSIACLTIYDMLKAADRAMTIASIELIDKTGGASGDFRRKEA